MAVNYNRWDKGSKAYERWSGNPWEGGSSEGDVKDRQQEPWPEVLNTAKDVTYMSAIEKEIIHETNKARWDPMRYVQEVIEPARKLYSGLNLMVAGKYRAVTREGVSALNECIREMENYSKQGVFLWAEPLEAFYEIALIHTSDQSKNGGTGHRGKDGRESRERIFSVVERGSPYSDAIENIAYGKWCDMAQWVVFQLLVDDGVSNRVHRKNIFIPSIKQIGVSVQSHPTLGIVAVQILGYGMVPKAK